MNLGIYGGTFDPIHNGHVHAANEILKNSPCDKIIFVPAADPPHKKNNIITPFEKRFQWIKMVIEHYKNIDVSDLENSMNISYSVDLFNQLSNNYKGHKLYIIMGSDMSATFSTWKDYEEILTLASPITLVRDYYQQAIDQRLNNQQKNLFENSILKIKTLDISSTFIKDEIKDSKDVRKFVPKNIHKEVQEYYCYLKSKD